MAVTVLGVKDLAEEAKAHVQVQVSRDLNEFGLDASLVLTSHFPFSFSLQVGGKTRKTGHSSKSQAPEWSVSQHHMRSFNLRSKADVQPFLRLIRRDEPALHFSLSPNDKTASVTVIEHHTLGKDKTLGSAEVDVRRTKRLLDSSESSPLTRLFSLVLLFSQIWRHISPAMPAADVAVEVS